MAGWLEVSPTNTNLLILCGMVGFLTGVTRTPFTSAILVLEMTDRHNVIFHLMMAGLVASIVYMLIDKHSLYDHLKVRNIHDLLHEDVINAFRLKLLYFFSFPPSLNRIPLTNHKVKRNFIPADIKTKNNKATKNNSNYPVNNIIIRMLV